MDLRFRNALNEIFRVCNVTIFEILIYILCCVHRGRGGDVSDNVEAKGHRHRRVSLV